MLYERVIEIDERVGAHGELVRAIDLDSAERELTRRLGRRDPRLRDRADACLPLPGT